MTVLSKGTMFDPVLVTDLISKVKGKSALANLSGQVPVPFTGRKEFIFNMDSEVDIVAENGKKSHGGVSLTPKTIVPIKFEYGARISNEFMIAEEEEQLEMLKAFNDGFAKKTARGLDIAAFHGINPRSGTASAVVGDNHFDAQVASQNKVAYSAANVDDNIETAIAAIEASEGEVSGMAISPACRQALAALKNSSNERLYPDLAWGGNPGTINGLSVEVNSTVAKVVASGTPDKVIVGDFAERFKWGYSKQIPVKIIEYGCPDNDTEAGDLQGRNQIYIRAEVYLGWGIMDPNSFAIIA